MKGDVGKEREKSKKSNLIQVIWKKRKKAGNA